LVAQTQVLSISENKSDSAAHATLVLLLQCEWLLYNEQELVPASALDAAAKEVSQPITLSGVQYYPKAMSRVLLAATDSSQQPIECINGREYLTRFSLLYFFGVGVILGQVEEINQTHSNRC
jgi:hypothetical protein